MTNEETDMTLVINRSSVSVNMEASHIVIRDHAGGGGAAGVIALGVGLQMDAGQLIFTDKGPDLIGLLELPLPGVEPLPLQREALRLERETLALEGEVRLRAGALCPRVVRHGRDSITTALRLSITRKRIRRFLS